MQQSMCLLVNFQQPIKTIYLENLSLLLSLSFQFQHIPLLFHYSQCSIQIGELLQKKNDARFFCFSSYHLANILSVL